MNRRGSEDLINIELTQEVMPDGKLMQMGENEVCPDPKQRQGTQLKYNVSDGPLSPNHQAGQCGALVHPESRSQLSKDESLQFVRQPWRRPSGLSQTSQVCF